jgi:glutaredoxin 3
MTKRELFGAARCPYTSEMRDWLEMRGEEFAEYDVEADASAHEKLKSLPGSPTTVPVLVEDGKVIQVGWQGRGCMIS